MTSSVNKPAATIFTEQYQRLSIFFPCILLLFILILFSEKGQAADITPIRTDNPFTGWTDVGTAGTTYTYMLAATASMISPVMDFDSYTSETLNFKARTYGGVNATENTITVWISTNNGVNWTNLGTRCPLNTTLTAMASFDLSSYSGTQVKIKFTVAGTNATIGAGLDDIAITGTASSCTSPTTQATTFSANTITASSMNVAFTRGNGNGGVLVVARSGSAVNADPTSGITYTANSTFGLGTQIGTGNYVVYNGTANGVSVASGNLPVSGLSANTTYHYAVYEYNATGTCYNLTKLTGNATTLCSEPTTQAGNITFSSVTSSGMTVNWTRGGTPGDGVMVLAKSGSAVDSDPVDGTGYTANAAFGSGAQIGTGNFVVFLGSGTSISVTGLAASTTYYFKVYEKNCTGASSNYNITTPPSNNQATNAATSNASDIIRNTGFAEPTNIAYASYQEANLTSSSLEVAKFSIRDGGATTDADALGTTLTDITFTVTNSAYIRRIAIYDGTTEIAEAASTTPITFSGLTLATADGGTKDFSIRASFVSTVMDNAQIQFTVTSATANGTGSVFAAANAGGASSSIAGDNNRIEVVATLLRFTQQPTSTAISASMSPAVTVAASDALNNNDQDYSGSVSVTSTGTLTGSPVSVALSSGVATFSTLTHTVAGTGYTLSAALSPLTGATSSTFDITTFTYLNGDYRTTATGASFASTTSWETYNGSTWSAASVTPETTAPSRIIVRHTGTLGGTSHLHTYNDIVVVSGGELTINDDITTSAVPFLNANKTLEVQNGGILRLEGYLNMPSSASVNFILRDGGYLYINQSDMDNDVSSKTGWMWKGKENFEDNSTVVVQNWDNAGSATTRSFLNPTYQITPNAGGNAMIGNLIYDYTPTTQGQTILPALTGSLYFCNNLTIINHSSTYSIAVTANKVQSPVAIINGNLTIEQGYVIIGTNYTANALQKITVRGNLDIQNTNPANPSVVYLHSMTGTGLALIKMWLYLEGNLTVASGASLTTGYDAQSTDHTMLYFLGTNAQNISGAGTINLSNVAIQKGSGNVTVTLNRNLTVNDTLQFDAGQFIIGNYTLTNGLSGTIGHQIGGSATSYVVTDGTGVYTRTQLYNSTDYLFPVGPSVSAYNPATINYTGTIDNFSARVEVGLNPTTGNDPYFVNRTWNISEAVAGGTTASLTLQWGAAHENASFVRSSSKVFHYTGGAWVAQTSSALGGSDPYTRTAAGLTSFSPYGVGTDPITTPVELLDFGAVQKENTVEVYWATASEINNDHFVVERSNDGITFSDIENIQGAGNSNSILNYQTIDNNPLQGYSYYRLKQVDYDGAFSYSNIVSVFFGSSSAIGYSNFVSNSEHISFNVNNSELKPFTVQIIDITGRIAYSSDYTEVSETVSVEIPLYNFVPGIYCLVISNNSKFTTNKFVVK